MAKPVRKYVFLRYVIDLPVVCISFVLATYLTEQNVIFSGLAGILYPVVTLAVWYLTASFARLYSDRRSDKFSEEITFILYAVFLFAILLSSVFFFLHSAYQLNSSFFATFIGIHCFLLILTKYLLRKYIHSAIFKGKLMDNVVVVGATESGMEFYDTIHKYYYYGYKCVGFLDNHVSKLNGCAYLGGVENLAGVLKTRPVDEVVIALPHGNGTEIQQCIEVCDYYSVKARIIPNMEQYTVSNIRVNNLGMLPVINVRSLPLDASENRFAKRCYDLIFTSIFFVLAGWWLMPLVALTIRLSSRGPVIFKQERWGLNNEKITCFKFRTMSADSRDVDEDGAYQQAHPGDPRITWIGRLLRKTNLDELPQFWNVIRGNMSVVGPRPHPTPLNLEHMHTVENYMLRHIVKPGITGWAQVNGCRGETRKAGSMQRRVNFDLYYIHRWTLWLDSQIILQTIINFIRGDQNAY